MKPGDLFFSTARDEQQNRANIEDAFKRGARAAVVRGWDGEAARPAFTLIECENPRAVMGVAASRFFGAPSGNLDLIGMTGTSGKTTTTYLLASIFEAAGIPSGIIGTIGIFAGGRKLYSGLTTPESIDFESALAGMESRWRAQRGGGNIVNRARRTAGRRIEFRACVFTNLGRDHLDYHGTIENYFAAKLRLFTEILLPQYPQGRIRGGARRRSVRTASTAAIDGTASRKLSFGLDRALDVHPESFSSRDRRHPREFDAAGRSVLKFNRR